MADFDVPLIIRGKVITDYTLEHGDRSAAGRTFRSPDVAKYVQELVMEDPKGLLDLYTLSLSEIYDYLDELGECLDLDTNVHWHEAFEISCHASNLSRPVLEHIYRHAPGCWAANRSRTWSRAGSDRNIWKAGSRRFLRTAAG